MIYRSVLALWLLLGPAAAQECRPVDWLALILPQDGHPIEIALEMAYPGTDLDRQVGLLYIPTGRDILYQGARDIDPAARLEDATIVDMFFYPYPLDFDLTKRITPWFDPGRVRNEDLFRVLYFDNESEAQRALALVDYVGTSVTASFQVTTRHCVNVQLEAALEQIAGLGTSMDVYFRNVGGGFNWRVISGTSRLSAHSFGISVDFNVQLGGYWRWSGALSGQATEFQNNFPRDLVHTMERFGFIWGGKWHHFDGMHFEYRPELILYSRLRAQP